MNDNSLQDYIPFFKVCPSLVNSSEWKNEPRHEISNNVVCATSKASDQPAHTRSLIRVHVCRLNNL